MAASSSSINFKIAGTAFSENTAAYAEADALIQSDSLTLVLKVAKKSIEEIKKLFHGLEEVTTDLTSLQCFSSQLNAKALEKEFKTVTHIDFSIQAPSLEIQDPCFKQFLAATFSLIKKFTNLNIPNSSVKISNRSGNFVVLSKFKVESSVMLFSLEKI